MIQIEEDQMAINFNLFPRYLMPAQWQQDTIAVFDVPSIDTENRNIPSNQVLAEVRTGLERIGFEVESPECRIYLPVLYGLNGKVEKSFEADAHHKAEKAVLEVEAGRAVPNNAFLKDLFEACVMQDVDHLVVAVCNQYNPPSAKRPELHFQVVSTWMDTFFSSGRINLPLASVLVIGY